MPSPTRRRLLLLIPVLFLFASCSEDFEVSAPYKHITVVYGLLNTADTAHYIRIQKAFLDENKSAIDMAKEADSSFYNALTVQLKELSTGVVETLQKVDLGQEGYAKEPGVFFQAPSYAYKTKRYLNPDSRYRLIIRNATTGLTDSAETAIIAASSGKFQVPDFVFGYNIHFPAVRENDEFRVEVIVPDNAKLVEGIVRFHYVDKDGATGLQTDRILDYTFASTVGNAGKPLFLTRFQREFYAFLGSAMPAAPANIQRYMDTAEVFVWAGSEEFATYQQINGAQGGLTADQIKPIYTNIKGQDVYGLLASRSMRYRLAPVTDASIDSLKSKLPALNFRGRSDH
jgi:hypothetical protein